MQVLHEFKQRASCAAGPHIAGLLLMTAACPEACAQVEKMTRNINWVYTTLTALAVVIFSVFVVVAGIEVGVRHRKLMDVWHIIVGAAIAGSGAVLAALMVN